MTQASIKYKTVPSLSENSLMYLSGQSHLYPSKSTIILTFFFCQGLVLPILELHVRKSLHFCIKLLSLNILIYIVIHDVACISS